MHRFKIRTCTNIQDSILSQHREPNAAPFILIDDEDIQSHNIQLSDRLLSALFKLGDSMQDIGLLLKLCYWRKHDSIWGKL